MIVQRVEKHIIKSNHAYYSMLDNFCFLAKNLYNHANFIVRNEFVKNNKWVRYEELDKLLKKDEEYPDYKNMPTAQAAQQVLRLLDKNWKSFFKAIKDWSKNKDKYKGKPKLPSYKKKNGRNILILTNQNVKLKNNLLVFPKNFLNFTIKPIFTKREDFVSFNQIRFLPRNKCIIVEIVYSIQTIELRSDNKKYCSIDIGIDNLVTIANNIGLMPILINGKGLKSINKYYNNKMSHYREIAKRMNGKDYTNRMNKLTQKRNRRIEDYMHKASSYIAQYCKENDISVLVIGYNKDWKQNSNLGSVTNQSFVQIPTQRLIDMICYKCQEYGVSVSLTEESYTSGTSFLDNEQPIKENYNKSRRVHRGLFISNAGIKINADVNASFQILKKVYPNAFADGLEGVALHPIRVNVA